MTVLPFYLTKIGMLKKMQPSSFLYCEGVQWT